MSPQGLLRAPALAGGIALCLTALIPSAAGEPLSLAIEQAEYRPIQVIHYEIGSKTVSGYFTTQAAHCFVSLLVIETSDPEAPSALSAARLRVLLLPGQVAGLDSEEGRSLNVTCAEDAGMLLVEVGERQQLVANQMAAQKLLAEATVTKSK